MYEENRWEICKLMTFSNFYKKKKKEEEENSRKLFSPKKFAFALPFFLSPKTGDYVLRSCSLTLILEDFQSKRENAL